MDCRNVALTIGNLAALRDESTRPRAELAQRPTLPPLLLHRLSDRLDKITAFLTRHTAPENP